MEPWSPLEPSGPQEKKEICLIGQAFCAFPKDSPLYIPNCAHLRRLQAPEAVSQATSAAASGPAVQPKGTADLPPGTADLPIDEAVEEEKPTGTRAEDHPRQFIQMKNNKYKNYILDKLPKYSYIYYKCMACTLYSYIAFLFMPITACFKLPKVLQDD